MVIVAFVLFLPNFFVTPRWVQIHAKHMAQLTVSSKRSVRTQQVPFYRGETEAQRDEVDGVVEQEENPGGSGSSAG